MWKAEGREMYTWRRSQVDEEMRREQRMDAAGREADEEADEEASTCIEFKEAEGC